MRAVDSGVVAIIGRHRRIQELLGAGLEVAVPQRDRGIDLIAYVDRDSRVSDFVAVPIQMKAATAELATADRPAEDRKKRQSAGFEPPPLIFGDQLQTSRIR